MSDRTDQIEAFLWEHIEKITDGKELPFLTAKEVVGAVMGVCRADDRIAKCSLPSIGTAARRSYLCQLSVDPGLDLAYLSPRAGECNFDKMYKGMLDLAYRSERVMLIRAYTVYQCDMDGFDYDLGTEAFIKCKGGGVNATAADRSWENVVCAYAVAHVVAKDRDVVEKYPYIVWRPELEDIRNKAIEVNPRDDNPYVKFWDGMCKKAPAKRVCDYLPQNPSLGYALALEGLAEAGKLSAVDAAFADVQDAPIPSSTANLAAKVGMKREEPAEPEAPAEKEAEKPDATPPAALEESAKRMKLMERGQRNKKEREALREYFGAGAEQTLPEVLANKVLDELIEAEEMLENEKGA